MIPIPNVETDLMHQDPAMGRVLMRNERATGIEPACPAWEAGALPLSYARDAPRSLMTARAKTAYPNVGADNLIHQRSVIDGARDWRILAAQKRFAQGFDNARGNRPQDREQQYIGCGQCRKLTGDSTRSNR